MFRLEELSFSQQIIAKKCGSFHFGAEQLIFQKKLQGWLVGVWDGTNLGWIPTDELNPNEIPKSQ